MKTLKRSFISIPYEPRPSQDPRCAGLAQHFQGVQVGYGGLQNLGVSATNIPKIIMDSLDCLRTFQLANVPKM